MIHKNILKYILSRSRETPGNALPLSLLIMLFTLACPANGQNVERIEPLQVKEDALEAPPCGDIRVRMLRKLELPKGLKVESIITHEVYAIVGHDSLDIREFFFLSCTFPECGSTRVLLRIGRRPFNSAMELRSFSCAWPRGEEYYSPVLDLEKPWASQKGFMNHFHSLLSLGEKAPSSTGSIRSQLLDANVSFFERYPEVMKNMKDVGFRMVKSDDLHLTAKISIECAPSLLEFEQD